MDLNTVKLIESMIASGMVLLFSGMGFLTLLCGIVLHRPENLAKLLSILKENFPPRS